MPSFKMVREIEALASHFKRREVQGGRKSLRSGWAVGLARMLAPDWSTLRIYLEGQAMIGSIVRAGSCQDCP